MSSISFKDKMVMHRHEDQQCIELSFKNLTPIPLVESGSFRRTDRQFPMAWLQLISTPNLQ
jgi:hypothetical protein